MISELIGSQGDIGTPADPQGIPRCPQIKIMEMGGYSTRLGDQVEEQGNHGKKQG